MQNDYDVIIVGSGAGGATIARELARARADGSRLLLLERGGEVAAAGTTLAMARSLRRFGLTQSAEGLTVVFANTYGGASNLTAGCAIAPPTSVFADVGIDLARHAEEAREELWIDELPAELLGEANERLLDAGNEAGFRWTKVTKFIRAQRCEPGCTDCMLGCRRGAKWTARVFGDEARQLGVVVKTRTRVVRLLTEGKRVRGVETVSVGRRRTFYANRVVLSAGMGNIPLLREAGIASAGRGCCCDWLQFIGAEIPGLDPSNSQPMAVGTLERYESDGVVVLPVFPSWAQYCVMLSRMGGRSLGALPKYKRYTGLMVKVADDIAGEVVSETRFSKRVTKQDHRKLGLGLELCRRVLAKAGAREDSLLTFPPSGAHPSATCRIGEVVDANLSTEISGLYCCDASVFPRSLGLPTVWTIVSLAKRLAEHLTESDRRLAPSQSGVTGQAQGLSAG